MYITNGVEQFISVALMKVHFFCIEETAIIV